MRGCLVLFIVFQRHMEMTKLLVKINNPAICTLFSLYATIPDVFETKSQEKSSP